MPPSSREARLEALCQRRPERTVFTAIVALLGAWPAGATRDDAVAYAAQRLAAWPSATRWFDALAPDHPAWPLARGLSTFAHPGTTPARFLAALRGGALAHLEAFHLIGAVAAPGVVRALAAAPEAQRTRFLYLSAESKARAQLLTLVTAQLWPRLRSLGVFGGVTDATVRALATAQTLPRLRCLWLHGTLGPDGAAALTHAPFAPKLRELSLTGNPLGAEGVAALLAGASWPRLRKLALGNVRATSDACRAFGQAAQLALETLDLSSNKLGRDGIAALASTPQLRTLKHVTLMQTGLDDDAATVLAATDWPALRSLGVASNALTAAGVLALLESTRLGPAMALNNGTLGFDDNGFSSAGLVRVAAAPRLARHRHLTVHGTALSDDAVRALATSPLTVRLATLALTDVRLSPAGLSALCASPHLAGVRHLALSGNPLGPDGAVTLAHAPYLRPRRLDLSRTRLGDAGVRALADAPALARIRELDLHRNNVTDAGVAALLASPHRARITTLDLARNKIRRTDARQFLAALPKLKRERLALEANRVVTRPPRVAPGSPPVPTPRPALAPVVAGHDWVLTGTFQAITHSALRQRIRAAGGRVSKRPREGTAFVAVGSAPGTKLARAAERGAASVDEATLLALLGVRYDATGLHRALEHSLAVPPSEQAWRGVCAAVDAFERWPDGTDVALVRHFALEHAATALAAWPDTLRVLPRRWLRRGLRLTREDASRLALARAWMLAGRGLCDGGTARLAALPALASVRVLDLSSNRIGPRGCAALAASPHAAQVQALLLDHNKIGDDGLAAIAGASGLTGLTELAVRFYNEVGAKGIRALVASPLLTQLRGLSFGQNWFGDAGGLPLVTSPAASRLVVLDLWETKITAKTVCALAAAPALAGLEQLSLAMDNVGDAGARALAASPYLQRLKTLNLCTSSVGDAGVRALAASPNVQHLEALDLSCNTFTDRGARALAQSPYLRALKFLSVGGNRMTPAGLQTLAEAPHLPRVQDPLFPQRPPTP